MKLFILSFTIGILLLQQFAHLPSLGWVMITAMSGMIILPFRWFKIPAGMLLGFAWCLWFSHQQLDITFPHELEGKNIIIKGHVATLPNVSDERQTFLFDVKKLELNQTTYPMKGLVRLSWQDNKTKVYAGDEWQFKVRLKKIHGTFNPGGYDYEAWAMLQGVRANGYIVKDITQNYLIDRSWYRHPIHFIRQKLKEKIDAVLPVTNTSPWIIALILGERQNISDENWDVLRKTGTNHLMAIAGLHIGFISGFIYLLVNAIWRRIPRFLSYCPSFALVSFSRDV